VDDEQIQELPAKKNGPTVGPTLLTMLKPGHGGGNRRNFRAVISIIRTNTV